MKRILIVVDMQKDFVDGALGTPEARAILPAVVREIGAGYDEIYVTYDTHGADYLRTLEGENLPVPHCLRGTPGWALAPEIAAALADKPWHAVEKPTFGSLALAQTIAQEVRGQAASVTLCGLCTDICVASNALLLRAAAPDLPLYVRADACAGTTPARHAAALETMASCQVKVLC